MAAPPERWKWAEFKIGDEIVRHRIPTQAEERRRAAERSGRPLGPPYVLLHDLPLRARDLPYYSPENRCDAFAAVSNAIKQRRRSVHFIRRTWRPGRPYR
jgi:hypothetical protein